MCDILQITKESYSYSEIARKIGKLINGWGIRQTKKLIKGFDVSHFRKQSKYKNIIKFCPNCNKSFETKGGGSEEKQTCSYSCSNSYFRKGLVKLNKRSRPSTLCFYYHKKECVVCKESKIVEVHHFDENHKNNDLTNLVPLCPTHHQYWHSRYKKEIEKQVTDYVMNFKQSVG